MTLVVRYQHCCAAQYRSHRCQTFSGLKYQKSQAIKISVFPRGLAWLEKDQTLTSSESEASTAEVSISVHHSLRYLFG